ncbi:hypothetical protein CFP56_020117, partial [Quercus suber]
MGQCMVILMNIKLETLKTMLQAQGSKVLHLCGNQLRISWGKGDLKKGLHQSALTHPHHCGERLMTAHLYKKETITLGPAENKKN